MKRFTRENISLNFILSVILIMLLAQSFLWFWSIQKQKRLLENLLEERVNEYALMIQSVTDMRVKKFDTKLIEGIVNNILKGRDIHSVEVVDNEGKKIFSKSKARMSVVQKSIKVPLKSGDKTIGNIVVRYSDERIKKAITNQIINVLFLQFGIFIVIAGAMFFLFQKKVNTPLNQIQHTMEQILLGDLTQSIDIKDTNEFGQLSKTVNFFSDRLKASISKLKSGIKNAVAAISQVNLSCKTLTDTVAHQRNLVSNAIEDLKKTSEIMKNVIENTTNLHKLSEENLSAVLQLKAANDEISQAAGELRRGVEHCSFVVSELEEYIRELNSRITETSASFDEASSSINEIRRSITEIDKAAKLSADLSQKATEIISRQGMSSIHEILKGMESIASEVNSLSQTIKSLGNRSEDIGRIVTVINDIAEKTRLLSLNAQILAVQSGEQGKSFAVVASQMSELSEKTAVSTGEIATLVSDIKKEIKGILTEIGRTVSSVKQGKKLVQNATEVLQEIYDVSKETSDMAVSIKRSTGEQAKGLSMVFNAVESLKGLIESVIKIVHAQEERIEIFIEALSRIKDSVKLTENSIAQQSENAGYLSENIEKTTESISQVSRIFSEENQINQFIIKTMDEINKISSTTERDIREVSELLKSLKKEVEELQKEVESYIVKK